MARSAVCSMSDRHYHYLVVKLEKPDEVQLLLDQITDLQRQLADLNDQVDRYRSAAEMAATYKLRIGFLKKLLRRTNVSPSLYQNL